ncbi:MAG: hypothetical protein ACLQMH_14230 [Solirubrobacteraceae bacterium]
MSPSTATPPTSRQLGYLRALAARTGTTFAYPATRGEASAEIDRLRKLGREPRAPRPETGDLQTERHVYATAVQDHEVSGFGASATWRAGAFRASAPVAPKSRPKPRTELARYAVTGAERVLYGERLGACLRITDRPSCGSGRSYLVERELQPDGRGELEALLADYVEQARSLDAIPMASGAVGQLFAQGASGA